MKKCIDCGETKPRSEFQKRSKSPDGIHCYCRECLSKRQKVYHHKKMMREPWYAEAFDRKQRGVRQCTTCKEEKPATSEFFHARKGSPDGCKEVCRICRAADHAAHSAERMAARKPHYLKNRDRLTAESRAYYRKNQEAQQRAGRERHHRNRSGRLAQMRAYRAENLDEINARRRPKSKEAFHSRYGVDLKFTLKHRVGALLRVSLRKGRKSRRMSEILGYTTDELRTHLEQQFIDAMSWDNFMRGEIHIDHIRPVSSFNITSDSCEDFKTCWALSNLRPMWAKENLSKGAKSVEEYEKARVGHKL